MCISVLACYCVGVCDLVYLCASVCVLVNLSVIDREYVRVICVLLYVCMSVLVNLRAIYLSFFLSFFLSFSFSLYVCMCLCICLGVCFVTSEIVMRNDTKKEQNMKLKKELDVFFLQSWANTRGQLSIFIFLIAFLENLSFFFPFFFFRPFLLFILLDFKRTYIGTISATFLSH